MSKRSGKREMSNFSSPMVGADSLEEALKASRRREKFAEPVFSLFPGDKPYLVSKNNPLGIAPYVTTIGGGAGVGLHWLGEVSNDAESRVDRIIARCNSYMIPETPDSLRAEQSKNMLTKIAYGSEKQARKLWDKVTTSISFEDVESSAKRFGVDTKQVEYWKNVVGDVSRKETNTYGQLKELSAKIPTVALVMTKSVAEAVLGGGSQYQQINAITDGVIAAVGAVYPVVGAALELTKSFILAEVDRAAREKQQSIADAVAGADKAKEEATALNVPVPWNTPQIYAFLPNNVTGAKNLENLWRLNYRYFKSSRDRSMGVRTNYFGIEDDSGSYGLNGDDKNYVSRWWAMANVYMGQEDVYRIFYALGWDDWGGIVASDAQVLMVAAPFAAQYGYDLRDFAIELWNACPGWNAASESSKVYGNVRRAIEVEHKPPRGSAEKSWYSWEATNEVLVERTVYNAWWLNWAVLAKTAFAISDKRQENARRKETEAAEAFARALQMERWKAIKLTRPEVVSAATKVLQFEEFFRRRRPDESVPAYNFAKAEWENLRAVRAQEKAKAEEEKARAQKEIEALDAALAAKQQKEIDDKYTQALEKSRQNLREKESPQLSVRSSTGPAIVRSQEETVATTVDTKKKEGLSTGAKVAIGVGIAAALGVGGYYLYKRSR